MKSLKEVTGQIVSVVPELRGYFTLKSLLHSGLKQVMALFTLGSTRAVLVVALAYSFPDVFNVMMALMLFFNLQTKVLVPKKKTLLINIKM
jgi:fructose-1,6-bisphosphatase